MSITSLVRNATLCLLALAPLGATGCESKYEEVSESCNATSECPLTQVCNRLDSVCEPEPYNRFLGSFSCVVESATEPAAGYVGTTDVLGWASVDGRDTRFAFNQLALCQMTSDGRVAVYLIGQSATGERRTLELYLNSPSQGTHAISKSPSGDQASGFLVVKYPGQTDDTVLGAGSGGFVYLENDASLSGVLGGYVDIDLVVSP